MARYDIYCVNGHDKIIARHDFTGADDVTALEAAGRLSGDFEIEAWDGPRFIFRLQADGTASTRINPLSPPTNWVTAATPL